MTFTVGDTVVYPHHGAAVIEAVEMRTIKGEPTEYLVLRVAQGMMLKPEIAIYLRRNSNRL